MASEAGDHIGAQTLQGPQPSSTPPHGCLSSSDPRATLKMEATLEGGCHVPLSPTGDILPLKQGVGVLFRELRLHTECIFLQVHFPQDKPGLNVFTLLDMAGPQCQMCTVYPFLRGLVWRQSPASTSPERSLPLPLPYCHNATCLFCLETI